MLEGQDRLERPQGVRATLRSDLLRDVLVELGDRTGAVAAFVLANDGRVVAAVGLDHIDGQPLAEWLAGSSEGLARLIAEEEFTILREDPLPQPRGVHCRQAGAGLLLVVVFDTELTSLGLVRHHSAEASRRIAPPTAT